MEKLLYPKALLFTETGTVLVRPKPHIQGCFTIPGANIDLRCPRCLYDYHVGELQRNGTIVDVELVRKEGCGHDRT